MNIDTFLYGFSILGIAVTGMAVLLRNKKPVFICFGIFAHALAAWLVSQYFIDHGLDLKIWIGVSFITLEIIAACFFLFTYSYPDQKILARKYWFILLLPIIIFGPFSFSNLMITNIGTDHSFQFGPLYYPQTISVISYIVGGLSVVILRLKKMLPAEKNQSYLLFIALVPFLIASVVTGTVLANDESWQFLRPLSALVMILIILYAIVKHRLFDIRLVVVRALTYTLLVSVLTVVYGVGLIVVSTLLFNGGEITSLVQQIYNIAVVLFLAFTLQPLRRFFQKITDSVFYRDNYDAQTLLSNLGTIMSREIELKTLSDKVLLELMGQLKVSKILLMVLDNNKIFYESSIGDFRHKTLELAEIWSVGRGIVVKDSLEAGRVPKLFSEHGFSVSVDLHSTNELVGYLFLGDKRSGDIFNSGDIKTLRILANELSIAIHNAKSYTQIQNFNKTLQRRIEEATKQLRDANEHLKELDQLKNEFLSMATHQLNTPLTVVDGYLAMVNDGVISDPAERKDYLEKTLERVRAMKRMVADFLNVGRIETGKFIVDVKPADLNKMVTEEINGLGPSAEEKKVLLAFIPPKYPVPMVEMDEQKTRQVIMNLIDNAIHYTPKGEVKVTLEADKDSATFKVKDSGIGVPENEKQHLFQKFYRASNAKVERPNGNGIGLFLVKRVIEDQGGKIIFESTVGKGSTFGFTLPFKSKLPKKAPTATALPTTVPSAPVQPAPAPAQKT